MMDQPGGPKPLPDAGIISDHTVKEGTLAVLADDSLDRDSSQRQLVVGVKVGDFT